MSYKTQYTIYILGFFFSPLSYKLVIPCSDPEIKKLLKKISYFLNLSKEYTYQNCLLSTNEMKNTSAARKYAFSLNKVNLSWSSIASHRTTMVLLEKTPIFHNYLSSNTDSCFFTHTLPNLNKHRHTHLYTCTQTHTLIHRHMHAHTSIPALCASPNPSRHVCWLILYHAQTLWI